MRNEQHTKATGQAGPKTFPCDSPKLDRVTVELRGTSHSHSRARAVLHRDQPTWNGVGNQTSGKRHRNSDFAAKLMNPRTTPPVALRKSPHTIRANHRPRRRPYHIPG